MFRLVSANPQYILHGRLNTSERNVFGKTWDCVSAAPSILLRLPLAAQFFVS